MKTMLVRTRNTLALGGVMLTATAGSLVSAPTAAACPINPDGSCIASQASYWTPPSTAKPKHAKVTTALIRRSHDQG